MRRTARELVDVKNEAWLQDGQRPIGAAAFCRALTLLAVAVRDDSVTFEFDDGDLFSGHRVKARMGRRDRFESADI